VNFLPTSAMAAIDAFDWEKFRSLHTPNRTRFYKYLLPEGNDMEVHTVAVKSRKDGTVCIKEVIRASVDEHWMLVKDVAFRQMAGYLVDWSPEKMGPEPEYWSYRGVWHDELYDRSTGMWKLARPVVNPEALLQHERFKWCAWHDGCGDILDYLKLYVEQPRIEMLAKAGAGRFAACAGLVRSMAKDKCLTRFLMANLPYIKRFEYGVDVIRLAYKRGIPLHEAQSRIYDRRQFRSCHLPPAVDATRALEYIKSNECGLWDYCHYLRNCQKLRLDITDTKNLFPKQFKRRERIVQDQVHEVERRANAELAQKQDAEIAKMAARFARLEKSRGLFRVKLPRRAAELVREGEKLHHCVGSMGYAAKMARGETIIAFVRMAQNPNKPFFTMEWNPKENRLLQLYGNKHAAPTKPVQNFVNRLLLKRAS